MHFLLKDQDSYAHTQVVLWLLRLSCKIFKQSSLSETRRILPSPVGWVKGIWPQEERIQDLATSKMYFVTFFSDGDDLHTYASENTNTSPWGTWILYLVVNEL